MNTPSNRTQPTEAEAGKVPAAKPADPKPSHRTVTDPREVVSIAMNRMNLVNTKKDELTIAIRGLVDITQQLTRTYAEQTVAIEQLRRRVKALEAGVVPRQPDPPPTVQ